MRIIRYILLGILLFLPCLGHAAESPAAKELTSLPDTLISIIKQLNSNT